MRGETWFFLQLLNKSGASSQQNGSKNDVQKYAGRHAAVLHGPPETGGRAPSPETPTSRGSTPHSITPVARPPEHFTPARPPDPYSSSRPPEQYPTRYYEHLGPDGRPLAPQPSPQPPRHGSPQTYARMSSSLPSHAARLREGATHSPPAQRYMPAQPQPQPPHNDRVPPIHHPSGHPAAAPPPQRVPVADTRTAQYPPMPQRREPSPYSRASHYERHPTLQARKYDPQQAYPGYRPTPGAPQPIPNHRVETHHPVQYKHTPVETISAHYPARPVERVPAPTNPYPIETTRRPEYTSVSRTPTDARTSYHYPTPSTSTVRYPPTAQNTAVPVVQSSTVPPRPVPRPAAAPKSNCEYPTSNHVQTSPARSTMKPGYPNQQARMTVSVTSLVNQMNQTKQKRESPLDLSVKTVKNSADSSTTQDDAVDSASGESKTLPLVQRPTSSSQHSSTTVGIIESHKVDFAPNFSQYRERSTSHTYPAVAAPPTGPHPVRYNGAYETRRPAPAPAPAPEASYAVESRHHAYPEQKYGLPVARTEYVHRIDLTRSVEERRPETRIRDDRNFIIENDRKRPTGPIASNIPEKIRRFETWTADSRIDRITRSAREQQELMSQPVYSYSSHKQFEAYQNEQRRLASATAFRDHQHHHQYVNHRYPYPTEIPPRDRHDHHTHYHDRNPSISSRQVIQKIPSHRDVHPHHLDPHSGVPADKRVLSILRNSLETKQTGFVEPAKPVRQIPDLIVIDDVDDSVIEITDLTRDNEAEAHAKTNSRHNHGPPMGHHIQMPRAVDSIASEYQNTESKSPPENDVARIRTKAELKGLPPSETLKHDEPVKITPKSQKQHLFNQIREDRRLESVIKSEKSVDTSLPEVKSEPMNIDAIEKDAITPIKTESDIIPLDSTDPPRTPESDDLDWTSACDSFMEQLKTGVHKKKTPRKRTETYDRDSEKQPVLPKIEPMDTEKAGEVLQLEPMQKETSEPTPVVIKQEPMDEDEIKDLVEPSLSIANDSSVEEHNTENQIRPVPVTKEISTEVTTETESKKKKSNDADSELDEVKSKTPSKDKSNKTDEAKRKRMLSPQKDGKLLDKKNISSNKDKKASPEEELKTSKKESLKTKKSLSETPEKEGCKLRKSTKDEKAKLLTKSKKSLITEKDDETDKINKTANKTDLKETPRGRPKKLSLSESDSSKPDKEKFKMKKPDEDSPNKVKRTRRISKGEKNKDLKKDTKLNERVSRDKSLVKSKNKIDKSDTSLSAKIKKEKEDDQTHKVVVKEEPESTDDDEPLIKSKLQKEKEMKYHILKDLSEKSAYVKLECFDVDLNKNTRISIDSLTKDKDDKQAKAKMTRQVSKSKDKSTAEAENEDSSSNSESEDITVAKRLRVRKNTKTEESKATPTVNKATVKTTPKKQDTPSVSNSSTLARKAGFGDGSDFHPGWEEELYKYKRSLRMPSRLIAIPRGRSGGPFVKKFGASFNRGSTSLPDLDPAPLSPAPSSSPSAATDDLYARRPEKLAVDSDLESNSSYSATNRLQYDSEASTSTVFSSATKKKGAFRKETVNAYRTAFIKNTDGLIGATEEFAPVVLKSRTRTESRVLKQRATIKEVFGDERPASAPPTSCRDDDEAQEPDEELEIKIKKEKDVEPDAKPKLKPRKIVKDKQERRSSSIRDGLRSTKSLKRNDAKGRLMRLKKRNSLMMMKSLANKRIKDLTGNKIKKEKPEGQNDNENDKPQEESNTPSTIEGSKRRFKRLFGRRKFSSGFDYIRKKKKIVRKEETPNNKIRRPAAKPEPESEDDIQKEIKGWFINKSVGETHLHRAARLGYTDCVAYCLEKMDADASAKDNAGFTPLHVASAKGHVRIARLLLQYGANVSAAANGGIRPLHEAAENCHVEVIRLLLSYGADPLLGTYAGQTPEELTEGGPAALLLRLHIADVQGRAVEPWKFPPPGEIIDRDELGCDPLASPPPGSPPPPADTTIEMQATEFPLPPFYSLKSATGQPTDGLWCLLTDVTNLLQSATGQPTDGLWCLLTDVTNLLQIKSKESLLKQIHCGSGSPKELLQEMRTQDFLERAQCHQLLCAGEKVNVRASKVALVRVTDKLRQLFKIETVLIS
ncbi:ankyrin repeats (3 copies) domain-containing protein [Phthorimaea operculella]|nr:ankyrin repeats (3 copies) domain-containing protein [Phthorimaea operculella]